MSSLLEELWESCQDYISNLPPEEGRKLNASHSVQTPHELTSYSNNTTTNSSDSIFIRSTPSKPTIYEVQQITGHPNLSARTPKKTLNIASKAKKPPQHKCLTTQKNKVPQRKSQRIRNQLARRLGEAVPSASESIDVVLSQSIFDPGTMEREAKTESESELMRDNGQGSAGNLTDVQEKGSQAYISGSLQQFIGEPEKSLNDSGGESSTSEPNSSVSDQSVNSSENVDTQVADPSDNVDSGSNGNSSQSVDEESMSDTTQSDGSASEEETEESVQTSSNSSTPNQSTTTSPTPEESSTTSLNSDESRTTSPNPEELRTPSPNPEESSSHSPNPEESMGFYTANSSVTDVESFVTPGLESRHHETMGLPQSNSKAAEIVMDIEKDESDISPSKCEVESADIIAALSEELSSLNKDSEHFTTPLHKSKSAKVRTPHRTPAKIKFNFKTPTKSPAGATSHREMPKFSGSPLGQFGFKTPPRSTQDAQSKQTRQDNNWKGVKRKGSCDDDGGTEGTKSKKRYENSNYYEAYSCLSF